MMHRQLKEQQLINKDTLNNDIKWKDRPIRSHHVSMIINKIVEIGYISI